MPERILIVDDEENIRFTFENFLSDEGYEVKTASNLQDGKQLLADESFDLVFLDILLGRDSGLEILRDIKEQGLPSPVVMITGAPEVETAAEAVRYGAFDYIPKPVMQENLLRVARMALEHKKLIEENETFKMRLEGLFRCAHEGIIITDKELRVAEINDAAKTIFGCDESIVGKGLDSVQENKLLTKFSDMIKARFEGEIYRVEGEGAAGSKQVLSFSASPLKTEDGADYGYVLIIRDESNLPESA
jgi:PAS domain S-box-containing protein